MNCVQTRHCERSEAIQENLGRLTAILDRFVAALLAMTATSRLHRMLA